MSKFIPFSAVTTLFTTAIKNGRGSGASIKDKATAQMAFTKINAVWTEVLKTELIKHNGPFTDLILTGSEGGRAIAVGTYNALLYSSETFKLDNRIIDATITFEEYEVNGLKLTGTLRFFDTYCHRVYHTGSHCPGKTETFLCYRSKDRSTNLLPPIHIDYVQDGKRVRDSILLDADKDHTAWEVKITNGEKETFRVRI